MCPHHLLWKAGTTTTTGQHTTQEAARESTYTTRHTPKSFDFYLLAMFTAGNMTYMRKRKKERQAAKRAMARENVS